MGLNVLGRILLSAIADSGAEGNLQCTNFGELYVSGRAARPLPNQPRKIQANDEIEWSAATSIVVGEGDTETSDAQSVYNTLSESIQVRCELASTGDGLITVYVLPALDTSNYADIGADTVVDSFNANDDNEIIRPPISLACKDWRNYKVAILNGDDAEDLTAIVVFGNPGF